MPKSATSRCGDLQFETCAEDIYGREVELVYMLQELKERQCGSA